MSNYYENKFAKLEKELGRTEALSKIVQVFLHQSSPPKLMEGQNKYEVFWHSYFIDFLTPEILEDENYLWALSQYIRSYDIDISTYKKIFNIQSESLIKGIRLSGIPMDFKNNKWDELAEELDKLAHQKIKNFIQEVNNIRDAYLQQKQRCKELRNQLNLDQLNAINLSGLYLYQYVTGRTEHIQIPYQIDTDEFYHLRNQEIWIALNEIIIQSNSMKSISEKSVVKSYGKTLSMLLNKPEATHLLELRLFCELVANQANLNIIQEKILNFCYIINHNERDDENDFNNKRGVIQLYHEYNGLRIFDIWNKKGKIPKDNSIETNFSIQKTFAILFWLKDIYGIQELFINEKEYELYDLIGTLAGVHVSYYTYFVEPFLLLCEQKQLQPHEALLAIWMNGIKQEKFRHNFAFDNLNEKARSIYNWISEEGSKTYKTKKMVDILKFWSCDLSCRSDSSDVIKPFYQIGDYMLTLPQRLGEQDLYTTAINCIRKEHKNRKELRKETALIEQNLATLFKKYGFEVQCSFEPDNQSVGEMDLVVIQNDTVLLIELKSTFVRYRMDEIYQYKHSVLNKASYQLDKKLEYLKNHFSDKKHFHSWIVDTTLEFDHQYFGSHLKVSLEELAILLKDDDLFLEEMEKLKENEIFHFNEETKEPNLVHFIQKVENNEFWENSIKQLNKMINSI